MLKKLKRIAIPTITLTLILCIVGDSYAIGRRRNRSSNRARRSYSNNYSSSNINNSVGSFSGNIQSVAAQKARQAAARGIKGHLGGGFGGANAEGVGWSTYSAQDALNNCCFTGQRRLAGSAVVRGNDGWYACKLFW